MFTGLLGNICINVTRWILSLWIGICKETIIEQVITGYKEYVGLLKENVEFGAGKILDYKTMQAQGLLRNHA